MFEKFTSRARRVLPQAYQDALLLGHNHIGTEHILLSLARDEAGICARALADLGADHAAIRQCLERDAGLVMPRAPSGQIPLTPRAKALLGAALTQSSGPGGAEVDTHHLLLGLLRVQGAGAITILINLGADPAALRARVLELHAGHEIADGPPPAPADRTRRKAAKVNRTLQWRE